jgi:hypothetical protein
MPAEKFAKGVCVSMNPFVSQCNHKSQIPPGDVRNNEPVRNLRFGFWEWNMSIIKSWEIKERVTAQFRAEIYNVTNSTNFVAPTAALSTPSQFGQAQATPDVGVNSPIVGTGGPRKIQFGLKFLS